MAQLLHAGGMVSRCTWKPAPQRHPHWWLRSTDLAVPCQPVLRRGPARRARTACQLARAPNPPLPARLASAQYQQVLQSHVHAITCWKLIKLARSSYAQGQAVPTPTRPSEGLSTWQYAGCGCHSHGSAPAARHTRPPTCLRARHFPYADSVTSGLPSDDIRGLHTVAFMFAAKRANCWVLRVGSFCAFDVGKQGRIFCTSCDRCVLLLGHSV